MSIIATETLRIDAVATEPTTRLIAARPGSDPWRMALQLGKALSDQTGIDRIGRDPGSRTPESFHLAISDDRPADMPGAPNETGAIACAGVNGTAKRYFVEDFLDEPIEAILSRAEGMSIARSRVLEICPLFTTGRREADTLLKALLVIAENGGHDFVVCMTTRGIRLMLRRLRISYEVIESRIDESRTNPSASPDSANQVDKYLHEVAVIRLSAGPT